MRSLRTSLPGRRITPPSAPLAGCGPARAAPGPPTRRGSCRYASRMPGLSHFVHHPCADALKGGRVGRSAPWCPRCGLHIDPRPPHHSRPSADPHEPDRPGACRLEPLSPSKLTHKAFDGLDPCLDMDEALGVTMAAAECVSASALRATRDPRPPVAIFACRRRSLVFVYGRSRLTFSACAHGPPPKSRPRLSAPNL